MKRRRKKKKNLEEEEEEEEEEECVILCAISLTEHTAHYDKGTHTVRTRRSLQHDATNSINNNNNSNNTEAESTVLTATHPVLVLETAEEETEALFIFLALAPRPEDKKQSDITSHSATSLLWAYNSNNLDIHAATLNKQQPTS